jgi:hypothetical protein
MNKAKWQKLPDIVRNCEIFNSRYGMKKYYLSFGTCVGSMLPRYMLDNNICENYRIVTLCYINQKKTWIWISIFNFHFIYRSTFNLVSQSLMVCHTFLIISKCLLKNSLDFLRKKFFFKQVPENNKTVFTEPEEFF